MDLWHVISMFGYTIGLCQSPLDPRFYEILFEALVINDHIPSAFPSPLTYSPLVKFTAAESFGTSWRTLFPVHSIHVNAMKISVYVKHLIQSRCKWSLCCTVMVIQLDNLLCLSFRWITAALEGNLTRQSNLQSNIKCYCNGFKLLFNYRPMYRV